MQTAESGRFDLEMFGTAVVQPAEVAVLRIGVVDTCGPSYSAPTEPMTITHLDLAFRLQVTPPLTIVHCADDHDIIAFWDMLSS
jgi:hypothetical protein